MCVLERDGKGFVGLEAFGGCGVCECVRRCMALIFVRLRFSQMNTTSPLEPQQAESARDGGRGPAFGRERGERGPLLSCHDCADRVVCRGVSSKLLLRRGEAHPLPPTLPSASVSLSLLLLPLLPSVSTRPAIAQAPIEATAYPPTSNGVVT